MAIRFSDRSSSPPPVLYRGEWVRLLVLCVVLAVVIGLVIVAGNPATWQGFAGLGDADAPAGQQAADPARDQAPPFVATPTDTSPDARPTVLSRASGPRAAGTAPATQAAATAPATAAELPEVDMRLMALVRDTDRKQPLPGPYYHLLDVARRMSIRVMRQRAVKKWFYEDLWDNPGEHRGKIYEVRGHFRHLTYFKASPNDLGFKKLWQGVLFNRNGNPYMIVVPRLPKDMPTGAQIYADGSAIGFFLRVHPYRAADGWRGMPMLMAKAVTWRRPPPADHEASMNTLWLVLGTLVVLVIAGLGVTVWVFGRGDRRFRKQFRARPDEAALEQLRALTEASEAELPTETQEPPESQETNE